MPRDVGVVLVAAGQGSRLGGIPKQYRTILGVPLLLRALRPFTLHPEVAQVALVLPPADAKTPPPWLAELASESILLVAGGAERTDSARAGLAALSMDCRIVLVHDAARPFVEPALIEQIIETARAGVGAVPAIPVRDTLKEATAPRGRDRAASGREVVFESRVIRTVQRERLWRAQTPQGFPRALLERAYAAAGPEGSGTTDDAALVERLGAEVRLVPGSTLNFKLTTLEDLELAEAVVRQREQ